MHRTVLIAGVSAVSSTLTRLFTRISSSALSAYPSVDAVRCLQGHCSSITLVHLFLNNSSHSYNLLWARQLSSYWRSILRWISAIFTPADHKNLITAHNSSWTFCNNEAAMLGTTFPA